MGVMKVYCKKCGGTGHMYEMQDDAGKRIIVTMSNIEPNKYKGYREVCQIECQHCDGSGVEGYA